MDDKLIALARIDEACEHYRRERFMARLAEDKIQAIKRAIEEYEQIVSPPDLGVSVLDTVKSGEKVG